LFIKILSLIFNSREVQSFSVFIFLIFFGCTDVFESLEEDDYDEDSNSSYIFEIEPRLPIDENGYYHLTLNRNSWQTLHRISGHVTNEDGSPVFYYWVEWESNLYWYLGDTLGYIVKRGLTDDLEICFI